MEVLCKVSVISASGLRAADMTGTSDPFTVVELGNQRLRTRTLARSLEPIWEEMMGLDVWDIHQVSRAEECGGRDQLS